MTLFITSSPFVQNADRPVFNPDNRFTDNFIASLPENPRGLFVASAPDKHDWTCSLRDDVIAACNEIGIHFSSFEVLSRETAHLTQHYVANCDFIVFAGGHLPTQNRFLNEIKMGEILKSFDGVAMGISAGAMNMARTVYATPEEAGESSPDFNRFIPGMGLTSFNVLPHYQMAKDMYVDGLHLYSHIIYPDSMGRFFIAMPDGSYIFEDEACAFIMGESYLVKDGEQTRLTVNGQVLDITQYK